MNSWQITLTAIVDLFALIVSLWLGFYLITRSPRSRSAWLAAFTVWCMSTRFLYNALLMNVPDTTSLVWLGLIVAFAVPLWFHLSYVLRNAETQETSPRHLAANLVIGAGYALVLLFTIQSAYVLTSGPPRADCAPTLDYSCRKAGPLYPMFVGLLIALPLFSLWNLYIAWRRPSEDIRKRPFAYLILATCLAYLGGLYTGFATWLNLAVPIFVGDALLGMGILLLGYAVAKYNALVEGRRVERDTLYSIVGILAVTLLYGSIVAYLYFIQEATYLTVILVLVLAVVTHSLFDGGRAVLDRVFYRDRLRELRGHLRTLAQEIGTGSTLPNIFSASMRLLTRSLTVHKSLLAIRRGDEFVVRASTNGFPEGRALPFTTLKSDEIALLPQAQNGTLDNDLEDLVLLVPLHAWNTQIGVLLLGPKATGEPYHPEEQELLGALAGQLATVVHTALQQEEQTFALRRQVDEFREREHVLQHQVQQLLAAQALPQSLSDLSENELTSLVEDGLRQFHDYDYLGEHPLAHLQVVKRILADKASAADGTAVTHLDRGKALQEILRQTVNKLRPAGPEPSRYNVPSRDWYAYIILHDSYVMGETNRDIMSRLYIGEGTYNRTRRRALRGVALALRDMERATQP